MEQQTAAACTCLFLITLSLSNGRAGKQPTSTADTIVGCGRRSRFGEDEIRVGNQCVCKRYVVYQSPSLMENLLDPDPETIFIQMRP
jgi:hypothetical protein